MIKITVEQLCEATQGDLNTGYCSLAQCQSVVIDSVSTDTRTIKANDLFIALKGPSFDAHLLLQDAIDKGASVLLVERTSDISLVADAIVVEVDDTRIALGLLSRYIKEKIPTLKCAAITGSNGKTTCKELLSAILAVHTGNVDHVLATAGNFNNDIGLPLTLLRLQEQHQFAVVELGANHIGEIAYTAGLAKPDVALINNVMPAHLEGFGSLEGVATAKSEIWSSLSPSGIAVVNLDANFAEEFVFKLQSKQQPFIAFSRKTDALLSNNIRADVFASDISVNESGQATFVLNVKQSNSLAHTILSAQPQSMSLQQVTLQLTLPGLHNVSNALAASCMALALGCSLMDLEQGLSAMKQVNGRLNCMKIDPHLTLIDDTYNANSASVRAGIDLLTQYSAKSLLICGDMGELGDYAKEEHCAIGQYAQESKVDGLFTVGCLSEDATDAYNAAANNHDAKHFADKEQLKLAINDYLDNEMSDLVVLVKGSRSTKMEEIVAFIKQKYNA